LAELIRTSNPILNGKQVAGFAELGSGMTLQGTVNKTGLLLLCAIATATLAWHLHAQPHTEGETLNLVLIGTIGGFVFALITAIKPKWSPVTAPIFALLEGLALGVISAFIERHAPGIAIAAVGLTFATLLVLLLAYRFGVIRVTEKFRMGLTAATGAVVVFYGLQFALGLLGIRIISAGIGLIGILVSLVVVGIVALNLILDFDSIENSVRLGAPRYMEWYGAFGIMVTLVWLYFEILRLLILLSRTFK
jgi:uncharacterized YccA/Bax inhibitor family protein